MSDSSLPVEIVAYAPTVFYHCTHCEVVWQQAGFSRGVHAEQVRQSLPEDLQQDFLAVSDWVHHLLGAYGPRLRISVVDAASLQGVWLSARHRLGRYPAVIVGGRARFGGADFSAAETEIERQLVGGPAAAA